MGSRRLGVVLVGLRGRAARVGLRLGGGVHLDLDGAHLDVGGGQHHEPHERRERGEGVQRVARQPQLAQAREAVGEARRQARQPVVLDVEHLQSCARGELRGKVDEGVARGAELAQARRERAPHLLRPRQRREPVPRDVELGERGQVGERPRQAAERRAGEVQPPQVPHGVRVPRPGEVRHPRRAHAQGGEVGEARGAHARERRRGGVVVAPAGGERRVGRQPQRPQPRPPRPRRRGVERRHERVARPRRARVVGEQALAQRHRAGILVAIPFGAHLVVELHPQLGGLAAAAVRQPAPPRAAARSRRRAAAAAPRRRSRAVGGLRRRPTRAHGAGWGGGGAAEVCV